MKNPNLILTGFVATLWMFTGMDVMGQGSLTPPGAPGATMKTLAQVEPRTPISSLPYTISEPGSYYVTGNLSSTGHGIIIQSSGVTVDLMGFSLIGDGVGGDFGIHVAGSTNAVIDKVVIRGGTISGFYRGLYYEHANNSRIERCLVSGNNSQGVYLLGQYGQCNWNTIADCTITENSEGGVRLSGSSGQCNGNTIADCTISGNGEVGVYLQGGGSGGQCEGNTIYGNTISRNTLTGVYLEYADGNRVEANNISGTTGEFMANGIRTYATVDNLILKNSCVGYELNFDLDPDDIFVPVEITSEIANIQTQQSAQQADIDQLQLQNTMLLGGQTNIQTQQAAIQDDPRIPISSLPYTISESGSYYVTGNLSSTGHGIIIQSSGVTVDLMGFSLTGDRWIGPSPWTSDFGIHVDGSTNAVIDKVVIKRGTISRFYHGLYCRLMNNSRIKDLIVFDNSMDGVKLYGYQGQCNGNTIADCTISDNGGYGVYLSYQCKGNTIADCTISDNGKFGVYLYSQCKGNSIEGNQICRNRDAGVYLTYADGNRVEGNNVWGTTGAMLHTYGIKTVFTTGNLILKNSCVENEDNYELDSDDTAGPIVSASGFLSATGDAAHPWANFSR